MSSRSARRCRGRCPPGFDEVRDTHEGWEKANAHYWRADFRGWVEFFMSQVVSEPHSTKQFEDLVGWGLETDAETLIDTVPGIAEPTGADAEAICRAVRCPVLVVHGDADAVTPYAGGVAVAAWTGGSLVSIPGGGHAPTVRDPVRVNLLIRDFVRSLAGPRPGRVSWVPARARERRVLLVSSPIGLGHARRDVAIAEALRQRCPDVAVDWLAQHPVTTCSAPRDRLHPASAGLATESAHIEAEAGEHDLHAFQAIRRMDEILLANFHVFHDVVEAEHYDLVDRRRGLGDRPLPAREPRAQALALRLADRLRRLAPGARRRRRGGGTDRRLQRRDGRAHRPLPAAARPVGVRRRAPTTW